MQEQPENTLIQLMVASREEILARLPWWRRWWWRVRGQTFDERLREFDEAVRSAPTRKRQ